VNPSPDVLDEDRAVLPGLGKLCASLGIRFYLDCNGRRSTIPRVRVTRQWEKTNGSWYGLRLLAAWGENGAVGAMTVIDEAYGEG
jgi:hypothetical protein